MTIFSSPSTEVARTPPVEWFGKYKVLGRIGTDDMAEILKCQPAGRGETGEVIVIRQMLTTLLDDKLMVQQFLDEARLATHLSHPGILRVHEVGRLGRVPYMAMEYAPGPTLRGVVSEARKQGAPHSRVVVRVLADIAGALAHAHEACDPLGRPLGLVHRDLTPESIVVSLEGASRLLDFGATRGRPTGDRTDQAWLWYVAPEQVRPEAMVDGRADVFSLGVCLYEAVTGQLPYAATDEATLLQAIGAGAWVPPSRVFPSIDPILERIIVWAMNFSVERRPSAAALARALDRYVTHGRGVASHVEVGRLVHDLFGDRAAIAPSGVERQGRTWVPSPR